MERFEMLGTVETSEGRLLSLHRRGEHHYIHLDGEELMSTHHPDSEKALAVLGCRDLPRLDRPQVLIGGLGFGFTLRAALEVLPAGAEVVVAELFPVVVEWNRSLGDRYAGAMEDPRARVELADVGTLIRGTGVWDAILLDVDNGPDAWCLERNGRLYDRAGLARIRQSLRPGGSLAVWSAFPDPAFARRLEKNGFATRTETVRAYSGMGSRHTLFLGRLPKAPARRRKRSSK